MERRTILILDSQLHRGGILEQGLNSRGFNVFRTSRSREASKLLQVLQPEVLILSWESEGKDFYTQRVETNLIGWTKCLIVAPEGTQGLRPQDHTVDIHLQPQALTDAVIQEVTALVSSNRAKTEPIATSNVLSPGRASSTVPPPSQTSMMARSPSSNPASRVGTAIPLSRVPSNVPAARTPSPSVMTPIPLQRTKTPAPRPGTAAYPAFAGSNSRKREWRGSLDKLDIARLFSILMRRQASGQLLLTQNRESRSIWFNAGMLISAESNQPVPAFPEILVRDGLLQPQYVSQFPELAQPRPGYRLQELGLIQSNQVDAYNYLYSEQVVMTSFIWDAGQFQFIPTADETPTRSGGVELSPLIIQGVREGYSVERLIMLLGGEDRIPQWFAHRSPENVLPLNSLEKRVLKWIDGSSSLRDLWSSAQIDSRVPYGLIYVLMILGYVTLQEPPKVTPAGGFKVPPSTARQETRLPPAQAAFGEGSMSPTPRMNPSLDPMQTLATPGTVMNPTASYRAMSPNRSPVRPTLQRPLLETGNEEFVPNVTQTDTQDPSAFARIEQKYEQIVTEDYFDILEISSNAGDMEIRRAYQRLKHVFSSQQSSFVMTEQLRDQLEEILQTIQEAYDVLGDPHIRELYRQNLDAS